MIHELRLRLRALIENMSQRVERQIAVAILVVGVIVLLGILSTTTPKPVNSPHQAIADASDGPQVKLQEADESLPVAEPVAATAPASPSAEDRLFNQLYAEYPELDPKTSAFQKLDDWDKATRLRDFSYRHTAFAASSNQAAYRAGAAVIDKVVEGRAELADAYEFFDHAQGGVRDGEAAELLQRLYASTGVEAFVVEYGMELSATNDGPSTHTLNLVPIKVQSSDGQPRRILSVQDPSLNVGYVDSQGHPIDYHEMLKLLTKRQADQIHFVEAIPGKHTQRDPVTVAFSSDLANTVPVDFAASWNLSMSPVWSAGANGNWIVRGPRAQWSFERVGDVTWKPALFQAGLPPESIYLHCFPQQIRGGAEGAAALKTAKELLSSQANTMARAADITKQ